MANSTQLLHSIFGDDVGLRGGRPNVANESVLESPRMDQLVRVAVFGDVQARELARWLIWQIGQSVGVRAASIHELYVARGRGEVGGFTVPAINVRGASYDTARSIFRAAKRLDAGAFILEIARSEIAYTDQRPAEYVSVMLAAALREGFRGPLFIQGDHFQVNAKKFAVDPAAESTPIIVAGISCTPEVLSAMMVTIGFDAVSFSGLSDCSSSIALIAASLGVRPCSI